VTIDRTEISKRPPVACPTKMTAFVTVGSTKFDLLVESVLSIGCLGVLERRGYSTLVIQYGNSEWPPHSQSNVAITGFKFKQSLAQDIQQADLVISHAGMRL
jgi:beta-1,4-N-acetylglucosaminyltransferase